MSDRPRVIVLLPDPTESLTVAEWLVAEEFEPVRLANARAALEEMQTRRCDLLIADAAIALRDGLVATSRRHNASMSSVVIGSAAAAEQREAVSLQTMYLARPLERAMLVCTASMAILEGRPTRRSPRKVVNRFDAIANGVPSHIIDVSREGLRLEVPREGQPVPPPYFSVRVPLVGVAFTVQRVWARSSPSHGRPVTWCGAALAQNRPEAEQAWRTFVDAVPLAGELSSGPIQIR